MDQLGYLCIVFVMLLHLFIAVLWSPEGKKLTSWLLFVMFIVILLFPHYGILGQVWYLIVSIPDPCCLSYLENSEMKIIANITEFEPQDLSDFILGHCVVIQLF